MLLLRHGESATPERILGAETDVGLSARGRVQARVLARRLARGAVSGVEPIHAVYSSGMRRARETAEPIAAALGLSARIAPELHERRMGGLGGKLRAEALPEYREVFRRWMEGDLEYSNPGGESYAEIRARVLEPFLGIARAEAGRTAVVVVHGVVIRVLLTTILEGYDPRDFERVGIDNAAVNDLRHDGLRWTARALNVPPPGDEAVDSTDDGEIGADFDFDRPEAGDPGARSRP